MQHYTYTLIIPHYNIPDLLERQLQTVPKRDDMQVIVIDDCSTVKLDRLEEVKNKYPWIEWLSTDINGGGGKARNVGLQHAKGKYLIFADADDMFLSGFDNLLTKYKNADFDILYFSAIRESTYSSGKFNNNSVGKIISSYNQSKDDSKIKFKILQPWGKIINRTLIISHHIEFEEIRIANDVRFSTQIDFFCNKILIHDETLYLNYHRNDSTSHTLNAENALTLLRIGLERHAFLKSHGIKDPYTCNHPLELVYSHGDKTHLQEADKLIKMYGVSAYTLLLIHTKRIIKNIIYWGKWKKHLR